jgi:hypothetical protein
MSVAPPFVFAAVQPLAFSSLGTSDQAAPVDELMVTPEKLPIVFSDSASMARAPAQPPLRFAASISSVRTLPV